MSAFSNSGHGGICTKVHDQPRVRLYEVCSGYVLKFFILEVNMKHYFVAIVLIGIFSVTATAYADKSLTVFDGGFGVCSKLSSKNYNVTCYGKKNSRFDRYKVVRRTRFKSRNRLEIRCPNVKVSQANQIFNDIGCTLEVYDNRKDEYKKYCGTKNGIRLFVYDQIEGCSNKSKSSGNSVSGVNSRNGRYELTVQATPSDATIRILNIKPKYKPGIELKPEKYHIEVSHPEHRKYKQWVELSNDGLIHIVSLEKFSEKDISIQDVISDINKKYKRKGRGVFKVKFVSFDATNGVLKVYYNVQKPNASKNAMGMLFGRSMSSIAQEHKAIKEQNRRWINEQNTFLQEHLPFVREVKFDSSYH